MSHWQLREQDTGVSDAIARDLLLDLRRSMAAAHDSSALRKEHLLHFGAAMELARARARGIEMSFRVARARAARRLERRAAAVARDSFCFGELVLAVASLHFEFDRAYPTDAPRSEAGAARAVGR